MKNNKRLNYLLEPILLGFLSLFLPFAFRLGFFLYFWFAFILVIISILAYKRWTTQTELKKITSMAISLSLVLGSAWTTWGLCIDQKKYVTHRMLWSIDKMSKDDNRQQQVRFIFKKFPHEFILVNSNDLEKYLLKQKTNEVDIKFKTTSDFGKMRGFNAIKIGDLTSWNSDGGGTGSSEFNGPSPWD